LLHADYVDGVWSFRVEGVLDVVTPALTAELVLAEERVEFRYGLVADWAGGFGGENLLVGEGTGFGSRYTAG